MTAASALPRGQADLVAAILRLTADHGFAPTLRELASALGLSVTTVADQLASLERKRIIAREPYTARSLRVRDPTPG